MLKNSSDSYGTITKIFHWTISIFIISLLSVGFYMADLPNGDDKMKIYAMHKATGVIVLSLILLRFIWKLLESKVSSPDMPGWQLVIYKMTHWVLYLFMFAMPISGMLMTRFSGRSIDVFGLFTIPPLDKDASLSSIFHAVHVYVAPVFAGLIVLHILAALYHHFIKKDNVLRRMV